MRKDSDDFLHILQLSIGLASLSGCLIMRQVQWVDHRQSWDTDNKTLRGLFRGTASSSEETRKCEEPAGGKKFTLSDANRQRFRQEQADGKIKACVPLLGCSPAGNQEYKICLESCETGGRGSNLGEK